MRKSWAGTGLGENKEFCFGDVKSEVSFTHLSGGELKARDSKLRDRVLLISNLLLRC